MPRIISSVLASACGLALLAGCAGTPQEVEWSLAPVRDQHAFLPQLLDDRLRPTLVVTAGPTGLVVGTGEAAPATRMVADNGQLRLVSEATFARMQQAGGGTAMGAGAATAPGAPATAPAPTR